MYKTKQPSLFSLVLEGSISTMHPPVQAQPTESDHSVSISISPFSSGLQDIEHAKRTMSHNEEYLEPQPISAENASNRSRRMSRDVSTKDKTFDSFKTWSGRLERQISIIRGVPQEPDAEAGGCQKTEIERVPDVDRYFNALEGPELDILKPSEFSLLPMDKKWPFLLRFPISSFGICLGVSSQAILWKSMADYVPFLGIHVCLTINLVLWCISIALVVTVSVIYSLKLIFYFEAVRREYYHPVRVNFFFSPWIACLFLAIGVPPVVVTETISPVLWWYVLMAPIFCLELKIYGQWMTGGQRRLSKVANPSNHLAIVGNFVGAFLGASMGVRDGPVFFFAIGLAHYVVLFVTLYQRLPTNEMLPKDLHPVFFLFVAAPSVASVAWEEIQGDFDYGSKIAFFVALFLYASLAVRINFFRGFRFSLAWWAYTFPMTGASIAAIRYSIKVPNVFTKLLAYGLCAISVLTVTVLLTATIIGAFVIHNLFPNDIAIAVTERKPKPRKKKKRKSSKRALSVRKSIRIQPHEMVL